MLGKLTDTVLQRAQNHAYEYLVPAQRATTNLFVDMRIYEKGETIGPEFQKIQAPATSVMVFADDEPRANFGHACR
jgi:hypothetical protein